MSSSSSLILFSHVTIYYTNNQPKEICYNETLCPYLSLNNYIAAKTKDGLTCRAFKTFTNRTYEQFDEMVKDVKRLVRSCSLLPSKYNDVQKTCSMYQCHDGSKCLSYHRLSDGIEDCTNGEDEIEANVCSRNISNRFTCDNGTKCIPQQLIYNKRVSIYRMLQKSNRKVKSYHSFICQN
jgi:hypothetical protein